jgi:NAD(P)H-hydrate epimerase
MRPNFDFLKREKDTHKGDYGHILIIAGSPSYTGAAWLCSQSALRCGAGLVTIAVPKSIHQTIAGRVVEAITLPVPDKKGMFSKASEKAILNFSKTVDCAVIGPGVSRAKHTQQFVLDMIKNLKIPVIIDADGLYPLRGRWDIIAQREHLTILTPHCGEMSRLTGMSVDNIQKNRQAIAKSIAQRWNCIIVLKGYKTVCTDGKRVYINNTGNPGMATGGMGDALSGIIGAFAGRNIDPFNATCCAVYIHGYAGDIASRNIGQTSVLATDTISCLPIILKKLEQ